jgi:hypothetical protein
MTVPCLVIVSAVSSITLNFAIAAPRTRSLESGRRELYWQCSRYQGRVLLRHPTLIDPIRSFHSGVNQLLGRLATNPHTAPHALRKTYRRQPLDSIGISQQVSNGDTTELRGIGASLGARSAESSPCRYSTPAKRFPSRTVSVPLRMSNRQPCTCNRPAAMAFSIQGKVSKLASERRTTSCS